jgi:hypothetical protein
MSAADNTPRRMHFDLVRAVAKGELEGFALVELPIGLVLE